MPYQPTHPYPHLETLNIQTVGNNFRCLINPADTIIGYKLSIEAINNVFALVIEGKIEEGVHTKYVNGEKIEDYNPIIYRDTELPLQGSLDEDNWLSVYVPPEFLRNGFEYKWNIELYGDTYEEILDTRNVVETGYASNSDSGITSPNIPFWYLKIKRNYTHNDTVYELTDDDIEKIKDSNKSVYGIKIYYYDVDNTNNIDWKSRIELIVNPFRFNYDDDYLYVYTYPNFSVQNPSNWLIKDYKFNQGDFPDWVMVNDNYGDGLTGSGNLTRITFTYTPKNHTIFSEGIIVEHAPYNFYIKTDVNAELPVKQDNYFKFGDFVYRVGDVLTETVTENNIEKTYDFLYFTNDGNVPVKKTDPSISEYETYSDFPISGNINFTYLDKENNLYYTWNDNEKRYERTLLSDLSIDIVDNKAKSSDFVFKSNSDATIDILLTVDKAVLIASGLYNQKENVRISSYNFELYLDNQLIDTTYEKYSSNITYQYDGLLSGNNYKLKLTVTCGNGQVIETSKNITTSYNQTVSNLSPYINTLPNYPGVDIDFSKNSAIDGKIQGEDDLIYNQYYNPGETENGYNGVTLNEKQSVVWDNVDGYKELNLDNVNFAFHWHGHENFTGKILEIEDDSSVFNNIVLSYNEGYFILNYKGIESKVSPFASFESAVKTADYEIDETVCYILYDGDEISDDSVLVTNDLINKYWWNIFINNGLLTVKQGQKYDNTINTTVEEVI